MKSIQNATLKKKADDFEKEITDFLETLPANDNICGVGFTGTAEPTNDNDLHIDNLEVGLKIGLGIGPTCPDEEALPRARDDIRELNFEEESGGRRGFLAEDVADFSY